MDSKKLEILMTAADLGSFTKASEELWFLDRLASPKDGLITVFH